ncbi:MAG: putative methyltransferase [Acidimicrobiales bacterium]|nr:putative methyltransferase [Acidimicrobiales bacterium]
MTEPAVSDGREYWESIAASWLGWTQMPGVDPYGEAFNLPELLTLVPPPESLTLDIGCGEGRVGRLLTAQGHAVVGLDGSPTLTGEARGQGAAVAVADGARLPIGAAVADLVVSSMVLMDVPDLADHLAEIARVLRPAGTLVMSVSHPISNAGFALGDEHLTYALGDYYIEERTDVPATRDGRSMPFRYWPRTLSTYLTALGNAGLAVVEAREPRPSAAFVDALPQARQWTRVPMFLHLRAVKR